MAELRVLMVTDGWVSPTSGSFDYTPRSTVPGLFHHPFSLYWLCEALEADGLCEVITAHRATSTAFHEPATARFRGFSFLKPTHSEPQPLDPLDAAAILYDEYHEIWLFGVEPQYPAYAPERVAMDPADPSYPLFHIDPADAEDPSPHLLTPGEITALHSFADSGGGLFATGDHEDLGYALCGRLARIRQMRNWWYPPNIAFTHPTENEPPLDPASPHGEPLAPSGSNHQRHDTLRKPPLDHNYDPPTMPPADLVEWPFNWQDIDTTPQDLRIVWRYDEVATPAAGIIYRPGIVFDRTQVRVPHPLLCGTDGPIDVLPDHPHEGRCVVPSDLSGGFYTSPDRADPQRQLLGDEWPAKNGHRQGPELVAMARVIGEHTTTIPPLPFLAGHGPKPKTTEQEYGVIGAYDGHAVDVGRIVVDATWHHFFVMNVDIFATAPLGSEGARHWAKITNYYRNIARWLAPREVAPDFVVDLVDLVLLEPDLSETFNFGGLPGALDVAMPAFGAVTPRFGPCVTVESVISAIEWLLGLNRRDWFANTGLPDDPRPHPNPFDPWGWEIGIAASALGGGVRAGLWERAKRAAAPDILTDDDRDARRSAILDGVGEGVRDYVAALRTAYADSPAASSFLSDFERAITGGKA